MADRFEIALGERAIEAAWHGPGADRAPTIVLLHEGLGSVSAWRDWPAELSAATGFGVLAYSRFGYGGSSPSTFPRPVSYMHEEALDVLPRVLDAAHVRHAFLVGHSDGASIALIHAGGGAPHGSLEGVVLMSPHVFVEDVSVTSIAGARTLFETTDLKARLAKHHRDVEHAFLGWNGVWLDPAFRSWNIEAFVASVRVPMLLVQEENDPYGTLAQLDAIERAAKVPVTRVVPPGAGHAPWKEQRGETTRAVVRFVHSVAGSGLTHS